DRSMSLTLRRMCEMPMVAGIAALRLSDRGPNRRLHSAVRGPSRLCGSKAYLRMSKPDYDVGDVRASLMMSASFWASLFPAAWSFCLALRSRALGPYWTRLHLIGDSEKQTAEVPKCSTSCTTSTPAERLPAAQPTSWDSW
ncbi:MAG TPA: hypothetical protein VFQ37_06510, partial [Mycobacterium sp.]|nr:hypothetical protein [Mycobacterium sp.]